MDKVSFRSDIRQNFFWKNSGHQEFVWLLKQFWATLLWKISNLGKHMSIQIEPQQFLKSTSYVFAYALKVNLQSNINFKNW